MAPNPDALADYALLSTEERVDDIVLPTHTLERALTTLGYCPLPTTDAHALANSARTDDGSLAAERRTARLSPLQHVRLPDHQLRRPPSRGPVPARLLRCQLRMNE